MLRLLLALSFVSMALVGCGSASSPQKKAEDGNSKISRMNEINNAVMQDYNIVLVSNSVVSTSTVSSANQKSVAALSKAEMKALKTLVQEFRNLAGDVLGIINSGDVTYGGDKGTIERAAINADNVLKALSAALKNAA